MATQTIPQVQAETRTQLGSTAAKKLRTAGRLPAVVYGHGIDPAHITLDADAFNEVIEHHAHMLEVSVDGKPESCLIKEVQWNYLGSEIIHVDLARVDLTETVTVEIEIELVGDPIGLKEGGAYLDQPHSSIEIECQAGNIPENIKLDVSSLKIGDVLSVEDLQLPEGVTAITEPHITLASVQEVTEMPDEEEEEGLVAEGAEPEVIGAKREDEEGEAGGEDED